MQSKTAGYRDKICSLPDHDRKAIEIAAKQLDMLNASFNTGSLSFPITRMTRDEILDLMDHIEAMEMEEFRQGWMFEPPYDPQNPQQWLQQARQIRLAYLAEQFELISRLRDDEPEAWDEINELYFDD